MRLAARSRDPDCTIEHLGIVQPPPRTPLGVDSWAIDGMFPGLRT